MWFPLHSRLGLLSIVHTTATAMEDSEYIRFVEESKQTVMQYAQEDWPFFKQSVR